MPNPTKRTLQVLLIADPGQPSRRVASIRDRFEDELQMTFDAEAHVDTCTKMIRIQSDQSLELGSLDTLVSDDYPDVDVVLMLTGIPRHTRGKPLVAEIQPGRDYAVVSYPTLGAWTTKSRLLSILLSCVNQLLPYGPTAVAHPYLPRWGRWSDDEGAGQRTLHAHTFTGGPRLLMGMTKANEPFRTAPKLSRAVAAAAATGAFGIFYSSIWQMSSYLSTQRLVSIGLIAIAVMVTWLITSHRLWDKPVNERLAPVVFYYNLSTVLTLLISVAALYVLLVIGIFLTSLVVIDPEFMGQVLQTRASVGNYLDIAWISAALGVVAGGLGASFDSSVDVKNLTHGRRLRTRVYTEDDETT